MSYKLQSVKEGKYWGGGSHCLHDIKIHWHLVNVNLSGLWLLFYS